MSDLVDRLRDIENRWGTHSDRREAADEIERLRDEARLMRETAVPRDEYEILRHEYEMLSLRITDLSAQDEAKSLVIQSVDDWAEKLRKALRTILDKDPRNA